MALYTPQQQAGILSFYDAPERGPKVTAKTLVIIVAVFAVLVIILDHLATV